MNSNNKAKSPLSSLGGTDIHERSMLSDNSASERGYFTRKPADFLGAAYWFKGQIWGVRNILCNKLFVISSYDPQEQKYIDYKPCTWKFDAVQSVIDGWAHEEKLSEVRS